MIAILSSEWVKTKRTAIRWLIVLVPVLFSLATTAYFSLSEEIDEIAVFQGFFTAWCAFLAPLAVAVLAAFVVQEEELAGHFLGYLSASVPRNSLYFGKFLMLVFCNMVSTVLALAVFYIGMTIASPGTVNGWVLFLFAVILAFFGTLPLLAIHLWLSFIWGTGASVSLGMCGLVLAILMGITELGDDVWLFIPWTWPYRLAKLPENYLGFTAKMFVPPAEISSGLVVRQLMAGTLAVIICLIIFCAGGIIWFNRWEGRKRYD
ncbi:lantibiotic immunity ABC transporter MutG family permease subunit [Streptococcus pantholopis]|uniref:Multidrug ABC transporter permease n=1 Tax=Streptococcus pantholopis TaxID=1811193 RepID=A0A172Q9F6_9STRE|nr:lantibiotic immunity ABC transporter MutG family permease subunit [Streptococcus pantholopis]AND80119.1 multidrug ABC transporter permease [Streptococcus pantholopis]